MDIPALQYEPLVRAALAEDIGPGDITSILCIPAGTRATAVMLAKQPGVIAGLAIAEMAFHLIDPEAVWEAHLSDGARVGEGRTRWPVHVGPEAGSRPWTASPLARAASDVPPPRGHGSGRRAPSER